MKYDFDELVERRGTGCVKWDECPNDEVIPLWVADMDFKAAPAIRQLLPYRRLCVNVPNMVCLVMR